MPVLSKCRSQTFIPWTTPIPSKPFESSPENDYVRKRNFTTVCQEVKDTRGKIIRRLGCRDVGWLSEDDIVLELRCKIDKQDKTAEGQFLR
jgi:hypothetical protein